MATSAGVLVIGLAVTGWLLYGRSVHALTEMDTIVLADFANTTGDPVFDGALRQGLSVQLEQSPFLSIISEQTVVQTLRLMGQSPDVKLTPEIAHELCQRAGSAAVLEGSIANLGGQYVLGVKAVNCNTGDTLTEVQERAAGKDQVLGAMDRAAVKLREKLGESLGTVQKYDTRLDQATTPSLEALQAYSLGKKTVLGKGDSAASVPLYQRAIRLDPNFALAYAALGVAHNNLGERSLAAENMRKAYELRERVSESEKFFIESRYFGLVTGDLEKARQSDELWAQTFPREGLAPNNLGVIYRNFGQYDKALAETQEALRLTPGSGLYYANLVVTYQQLNRLDEAKAAAADAQRKNLDSPRLRSILYEIAFLQNDADGMARQVDWSARKPGAEDVLLALKADTEAYFGKLAKAREFSRQAVASAKRAEEKETAAGYEAEAALHEALFGNAVEARQRAAAALGLSPGRNVKYGAALALGLAGDPVGAAALAEELAKQFPEDTAVNFNYLPTIRAQLAVSRNDAAKAIEILQAATPFELGNPGNAVLGVSSYPVYVRGEAYLAVHQGREAAVEFQKILDHRGVVVNEPIGALAHLGLARAYALLGDTAKAHAAYDDFFTVWKDPDPDLRILRAAKAEYARLH